MLLCILEPAAAVSLCFIRRLCIQLTASFSADAEEVGSLSRRNLEPNIFNFLISASLVYVRGGDDPVTCRRRQSWQHAAAHPGAGCSCVSFCCAFPTSKLQYCLQLAGAGRRWQPAAAHPGADDGRIAGGAALPPLRWQPWGGSAAAC